MAPRVVISAFNGMAGKAIITLGIMRELKVAPFENGPNYIDLSYHRWASGAPSRSRRVNRIVRAVMRRLRAFDTAVTIPGITPTNGTLRHALRNPCRST